MTSMIKLWLGVSSTLRVSLVFGFCCLILVGCDPSLTAPHVYDPARFDRDDPDFAKEPTDINEVTICYNSLSSTPDMVAALAMEQCGRFRKTAIFVRQRINNCPLANPISAEYRCVGP